VGKYDKKMHKIDTHEFGGKIGNTNFKKPYLELLTTKLGTGGLNGNIKY
jgi:hypothetical protein